MSGSIGISKSPSVVDMIIYPLGHFVLIDFFGWLHIFQVGRY